MTVSGANRAARRGETRSARDPAGRSGGPRVAGGVASCGEESSSPVRFDSRTSEGGMCVCMARGKGNQFGLIQSKDGQGNERDEGDEGGGFQLNC